MYSYTSNRLAPPPKAKKPVKAESVWSRYQSATTGDEATKSKRKGGGKGKKVVFTPG